MLKTRLTIITRRVFLKPLLVTLLLLGAALTNGRAQSAGSIFRDDFDRNNLGEAWYAPYSWSVANGAAYNYVDGTGGKLISNTRFTDLSYVIETSSKGFTRNYYREFRIVFGQTNLTADYGYVLSYTPYSGGQLTLSRTAGNLYYGDVLDEVSVFPELETDKWYQIKIARYKSGLIQVYLDKGEGYSAIPLLEAIDLTYPQLGHFGWQIDTQTSPEDFFVDWITALKPDVEKPANPEKPLEDDLITQVSAASGRTHRVTKMKTGEKPYTDREYTITSVPSYLEGASFIQTAMADKKDSSAASLSFVLKKDVILYVGYDPRGKSLPAWLSGWKKTGDVIGTSDPASKYLEVYSRMVEYPETYPNPVFLGGNLAQPATGAQINYVVAAVERPAGITLEAEEATLAGPIISTEHPGYSGTGFVDYLNSTNDYIEWTVNITTPGTYNLGFNYSVGNPPDRTLVLSVDGSVADTSVFTTTGSWESWGFYSAQAVYFSPGAHTIRTTAIGTSGPNIDYLRLQYVSPGLLNAPVPVALNQAATTNLEKVADLAGKGGQVYPNPFTESTNIAYSLNEPAQVNLTVYTPQGQQMQILVNQNQAAGNHVATVDGGALASGIYIYRLQTGNKLSVGKIIKR